MAEAFLNTIAGDRFVAQSAGLEPGVLNPVVVEVMTEAGIDISKNETTSVNHFLDAGASFDYVITVCDAASAEKCPYFPGGARRLSWSFPDPSGLQGSHEEKLKATRVIRDAIRDAVQEWVETSDREACP